MSPAKMTEDDIYKDIDASSLTETASKSMLQYGSSFYPSIITKASGLYIYTSTGHRMLDWTSGQMSCLIGHGHPEIVQTITQHAMQLDHLFSGMLSPPVIQLGEKLTGLLPKGLDKALFLSTGGEANEAAIKLAKTVTGRFEIVGLGASWHGMTSASLGATYHSGRVGAGPSMPGNIILPAPNAYRSRFRHPDGSYDWKSELDYGWELVDRSSCGSLAACIIEPILSSAGMHVLPPGYMQAMKEHCEQRRMLLIVDEAQTAIGRAGDMFAFEHDGVVPDILTLSKTLGNGLPLSAVVTSDAIAKASKEKGYLFYTTHINDPLPCAVGLKVLDVVVRDGLVERSRRLGEKLHAGLKKLQERYDCIGDIRGRGLMAGVEIVADRKTKQQAPDLGSEIAGRMQDLGLWAQLATMASFGGIFRIAPPITISEEQLDEGLAIMEQAFKATPGSLPLY